jgi:hypothetical protein
MRRLSFVLAALAGLNMAAPVAPALAAQSCPSAADQSAYEILALRELMTVLVIKCKRENEYNVNFIKRFQPALQANDRAVLAYFRRVYGGAGQGRMDVFTTELVNVMSQQANAQGTEFCPRTAAVISEMNALRSLEELGPYAAVKDLGPAGATMCPAVASRGVAPRKR